MVDFQKCKVCSRDLAGLYRRVTLEAGEGLLGAKGPYCEACWERLETAKAIAERYNEDYG